MIIFNQVYFWRRAEQTVEITAGLRNFFEIVQLNIQNQGSVSYKSVDGCRVSMNGRVKGRSYGIPVAALDIFNLPLNWSKIDYEASDAFVVTITSMMGIFFFFF